MGSIEQYQKNPDPTLASSLAPHELPCLTKSFPTIPWENNHYGHFGNPALEAFSCNISSSADPGASSSCELIDVVTENVKGKVEPESAPSRAEASTNGRLTDTPRFSFHGSPNNLYCKPSKSPHCYRGKLELMPNVLLVPFYVLVD